ncbi:ice-binding family protein [Umezawaea endophytica]|uniref:Ice-binding family protein n=1 Tax=Umezawaea endophytica TaxID=1654476 RepID=A0A9X3AG07_9PSEU|nr:ice-binding family protein [Umezawaea endophytica]MCS7479447.1 ice-binding family protein [Umezawaea endophytica]
MNGDPVRTGRFDRKRWGAVAGIATAATTLVVIGLLAGQTTALAAESPVLLGTAQSYSVLGGVTVTNTGDTLLGGDLGVSPGDAITGFPPGIVGGATTAGDAVAAQAQSDLVIAYDDAAGRALTASVADDLVGRTLPGGVYKSTGPLALSGTLTLDGQNDPNSVFIFQIASTLITASASDVNLINGAQACNVYWQVGSSATLGTNSTFVGSVLALSSISVTTGAVVEGRALARNGQVSLDTNVFTVPGCDLTPITTTTTDATTTDSTTTTEPTTTTTDSTTTDSTTTTTDSTTTTDESTTTTDTSTTDETTTTTEPTTTTTDTSTTDESTTTTQPTTTTDTTTTDTSTTDTTTTTDESTTTTAPTTTTTGSSTTTPTSEATTTTPTSGATTSGATTAPEVSTDSSGTAWTASESSTTESAAAGRNGTAGGERVWTDDSGSGQYPSGLASTGVSSGLGAVLAVGVLLLLGGALLVVTLRSRRSRKM